MSIPEYQLRVINECKELEKKSDALATFFKSPLFAELDEIDSSLLKEQHTIMWAYSEVLKKRMDRF